jgi:hypothetical protein
MTEMRMPPSVAKLRSALARRRRAAIGSIRTSGDHSPSHAGKFRATREEASAAGVGKSETGALFLAHEGRQIHKWTHYFDAYDREFAPYRHGFPQSDGSRRPLRFLEIGVAHGGSLQLWRRYFGPDAAIWGVDVEPQCAAIDDPDLEVRIGSQADRRFLLGVVSEMGGVDIVLDDGSHRPADQRASFEVLFPLVSDGGLYAVEDLHASYSQRFGGGYRRSGTFIEAAKDIIDDMHAWYHEQPAKLLGSAESGASQLSVYNGIVFIHKAVRRQPMVVKVGKTSF